MDAKRIVVTGGAGFLGRAVVAKLANHGLFVPRRAQYDLTEQSAVRDLYELARPDIVVHLAAEVGGIGANQANPGRYFYANAMMGLNLLEEGRKRGLERFVQVGTVCSYPARTQTPFRESDLWDGYPETTNAPYGVAKRALGVMLEAYKRQYDVCSAYLIPVNLYGPHDNFDLETSHVIPAMVRKFCTAIERGESNVVLWGSGFASREFLYVDDAAEAIAKAALMIDYPVPINLGTGREITIAELAKLIAKLCGYEGNIVWDTNRPDGQKRRQLDTKRAEALLRWKAKTSLEDGLAATIDWFRSALLTDRQRDANV